MGGFNTQENPDSQNPVVIGFFLNEEEEEEDAESFFEFEFQIFRSSQLSSSADQDIPVSLVTPVVGEIKQEEETTTGDVIGMEEDQKTTTSQVSDKIQVDRKEKNQKPQKTREIFLLNMVVVQNGLIGFKNLIKHQTRRIKPWLVFNSEAYSHDPTTNSNQRTTRSPFNRKIFTHIYTWLKLKYAKMGGKKQLKPRIVEINGKGPMNEVLVDIITSRRPSMEDGNRRRSFSAPPSQMQKSGLALETSKSCAERESSITSAISFCKRSYVSKV